MNQKYFLQSDLINQQSCSYLDIQYFCPQSQIAVLLCSNQKCKHNALICELEQCECNKNHSKCTLINLKYTIDKIRNKNKTLFKKKSQSQTQGVSKIQQSVNTITLKLNELIQYLSDVRQTIENYRDSAGWNEQQKQFIDILDHSSTQNINGKLVSKIRQKINWKSSLQNLKIQSEQFYYSSFQKLKKHVENVIFNQMELFPILGKRVQMKFKSDYKRNAIDKRSIQNIVNSVALQKLHIQWCSNLSTNQIDQILQMPSVSLRELRLQNCLNFSSSMIKTLITKHPNIQYFQYSIDWRNSFRQYQQAQQFMDLNKEKQQNHINYESCLMLSKLKYLKNIWIPSPAYGNNYPLSKMQLLQQIVIGNRDGGSNIPLTLFDQLKKKSKLKSLTLKNISNNGSLDQLFEIFLKIQSVIFYWTPLCTDSTLEKIDYYCKNITQLVIRPGLKIISGKSIWNMKNLKILDLNNCGSMKPQSVAKGLINLTNLIYFSSQLNPWANDKILQVLAKLKKLQFLRINDCIKVSSSGLLKLKQLKNIQTFICERNNKFYGKDFVMLCESWGKLLKLSLSWDDYHQNLPQYIAKVSKITHLSIKNSKQFRVEDIQLFKDLKCLKIGNNESDFLDRNLLSSKFKNRINIFQDKSID